MSFLSQFERLQEIGTTIILPALQGTVNGTLATFAPSVPERADPFLETPTFYIEPADVTYAYASLDIVVEGTFLWRITLIGPQVGTRTNPMNEIDMYRFMSVMQAELMKLSQLELNGVALDGVVESKLLGAGALRVAPYPFNQEQLFYYMGDFTVQVIERFTRC